MKKFLISLLSFIIICTAFTCNTVSAAEEELTKNPPADTKIEYVNGTGLVISSNNSAYIDAVVANAAGPFQNPNDDTRNILYPIVFACERTIEKQDTSNPGQTVKKNIAYTQEINKSSLTPDVLVKGTYKNKSAAIVSESIITDAALDNGEFQCIVKANGYYNLRQTLKIERKKSNAVFEVRENNSKLRISSSDSEYITKLLDTSKNTISNLSNNAFFSVPNNATSEINAQGTSYVEFSFSSIDVFSGHVELYILVDGYESIGFSSETDVKGRDHQYELEASASADGGVTFMLKDPTDEASQWLLTKGLELTEEYGSRRPSGNIIIADADNFRNKYNFPMSIPSYDQGQPITRYFIEKIYDSTVTTKVIGFRIPESSLMKESISTGEKIITLVFSQSPAMCFDNVVLSHGTQDAPKVDVNYDKVTGSLTIESTKDYIDNLDTGNMYLGYYLAASSPVSLSTAMNAPYVENANDATTSAYKIQKSANKVQLILTKDFIQNLVVSQGLKCGSYDFLFRNYKYSFVRTDYRKNGYDDITITPTVAESKEITANTKGVGFAEQGKQQLKNGLGETLDHVFENKGEDYAIGEYQDRYLMSLKPTDEVACEVEVNSNVDQADANLIESTKGNKTIIDTFDLQVNVYVNDNKAQYKDANGIKQDLVISELEEPVEYGIEIPADLPAVEDGKERVFTVERVHEGVHETINVTVKNGKAYFESDLYSTYALSYRDVKKTSSYTNDAYRVVNTSVK